MRLWHADDRPIFVDDAPRRRRLVLTGGAVTGAALALAALVLVSGFTGVGHHQVPTWPDGGTPAAPSGRVTDAPTSPAPSGPAASVAGAAPIGSPGTGATAPGAGATTPGARRRAGGPDAAAAMLGETETPW